MEIELKTYQDLQDFLATLSPEQLAQKIRFWGDLIGGTVENVTIFQEDYINPSGEGIEPISAYADDPDIDNEDVILPKDTVMLGIEYHRG